MISTLSERATRWTNLANDAAALLAVCIGCVVMPAQAAIVPRLNQGEKLIVVAIGTSLTAPNSTWFTRVGAWLQDRYPGQIALHNEAIGATASKYTATYAAPGSGLDVQLPKALEHNPDVIFIEFAMNDAYLPYGISPQTSKDNLQTMINRINTSAKQHGKSVDIVVQTMNNVLEGSPHAASRPQLADYYQGCREVAAANGLLLIDHARNWVELSKTQSATWNSYVPDGIHPNDLGAERVIVPEVQRALNAQVADPTGSVP